MLGQGWHVRLNKRCWRGRCGARFMFRVVALGLHHGQRPQVCSGVFCCGGKAKHTARINRDSSCLRRLVCEHDNRAHQVGKSRGHCLEFSTVVIGDVIICATDLSDRGQTFRSTWLVLSGNQCFRRITHEGDTVSTRWVIVRVPRGCGVGLMRN
jgi:hypothetical protein